MSTLQFVLLGALAVLGLVWLVARRRRRPAGARVAEHPAERLDTVVGWPPRATRILGPAERRAHAMLVRALPDHLVLAQVPVARFVAVAKRNSYADWLRRVGYQCVDLVVCDMATQVVAAIELQPAQPTERGRKRLLRMARTLKAAEVPLHVWREDALPAFESVRTLLLPVVDVRPRAAAAATAAAAAVPVAPPGAPLHWDDPAGEPVPDETIEMLDPPSSTWYDELDSDHVPLVRR